MNAILADVFALYMKTKNFHWHMSGPHCTQRVLDNDAGYVETWIDETERRTWFLASPC